MDIREVSVPVPAAGFSDRPRHERSMSATAEVIGELVKVTDLCLIIGAAAAAYLLHHIVTDAALAGGPGRYTLPSLFAGLFFVVTMTSLGAYDLKRLIRLRWQLSRAFCAWMFIVTLLVTLGFLGKLSDLYSRFWVVACAGLALSLLAVQRTLLSLLLTHRGRALLVRNVVILGPAGEVGSIAARLQEQAEDGIALRGVFTDHPLASYDARAQSAACGDIDDLLRLAQQVDIDQVILALPLTEEVRIKDAIDRLKRLPGEVLVSVGPIGAALSVRGLSYVGGLPMLEVVGRPIKRWALILKWIEDKVLALLAVIFLAPLMTIIAVSIKLDSRGPVLFRQDRYGFNNKVIKVFKFRTMYVDREDPSGGQRTIRNDHRVTRIGRLLRATSLDELPQLINVLKGEMSLVGPRPHATAMKVGGRFYCDAVDEYTQRHRVKPGITGWAQIHGFRGEVDSLEKARARVVYDLHYIEQWSIWLDLKILLLTVPAILSRQNAY